MHLLLYFSLQYILFFIQNKKDTKSTTLLNMHSEIPTSEIACVRGEYEVINICVYLDQIASHYPCPMTPLDGL